MDLNMFLALCSFALVTSITPGPNNLMLLASGMNFGLRASTPHMLGIGTGFFVMLLAVGLGLAEFFSIYPVAYTILKWLGSAYLLYLAWCIANAGPIKDDETRAAQPISFLGAAAFQWVNPKAWVMAIGAFSTYAPPSAGLPQVIGIASLFVAIGLPAMLSWALFGTAIKRLLRSPAQARAFNVAMGLLLVASIIPTFLSF